ncbi:MAG: glycohydrolase toxin TNT-related protein [Mycobacterium sp.]
MAAAMSTLTGGFNANTGYDAAGIVFGRQYVSAGASLLKAITAGVNACRNNGYGLQTSAVNYSRAEAASDLSGRAQVLGSPPCPAPVAVPGSPSSSGASVPPPLLWSVVAQFVGSPWPDGNPAEMRAAAAAWRAMAVPLYQVSGDAAGAYNTIAAQRIAEGRLMTADIRDIGSNLAGVASSCQQLAATLEQYAGQVEKTQQAIRQLCDQVGSIGGIVGTFFEFLHGHGEDELHKIADEIETVLTYLGTEADAALALLESAKSSVDSWVLGLEKSADRTFVEFFGDQVGGALATHFNAVADSAEGVFRWGAGMAEGVIALDPTRFASSPDVAGRAWEGVAKFAQLVTNPAAAIASDPQGSLDTVKGLVHADDWSKDRPMLGASQNLLDIASVVIPGVGEAGAAGDAASAVGRVARTSEEPAGAAGTIGKVGEFGRSTAALGGVTKDVAGLTEKLGAIADKPSAPPAGGRPASLTDPVDAGPRAPVAKQPDPESAPAVGRPDEPAGGDVAAGVSDHPTAQVGGERVPGGSDPTTHTPAPAVAAGAGEGAPRLPPVTTTGTDTAAPLSAAERAPAVAGGSGEALKPVGGLAPSASDRLTGLGNSSKFPAADDHASLATDIGTHASVGDGVERGVPLGAGHRDDYGGGDPPPGSGDHSSGGDHRDPLHSSEPAGEGWTYQDDYDPVDAAYGSPLDEHWDFPENGVDADRINPKVAELISDPSAPFGRAADGRAFTAAEYAERFNKLGPDGQHWVNFPNNAGAVHGTIVKFDDLQAFQSNFGLRLDRIGDENGKYLAVMSDGHPAAWEGRALHVESLEKGYYTYTIDHLPPGWKIEASEVAPGLGQPGGSIQIRFFDDGDEVVSIDQLTDELGVLK